MSNAHDYYGPGGYPELHNRGEGRRYIEPDYLAQEADDQLPMISTLGCGPRGHGVYPHIVKSTDGEFRWQLVDDVTGEAVMDSPNLSAGKIEIVQPDRELLEGEEGSFDVRVVRGKDVQSYTVKTPAGSHGSRIYLLGGVMTRRADETYTCVEADLTVYGGRWSDCPSVRPGDIVVFSLKDSASRYLAFGTVQKASPAQVAFTSRTRFEWRLPYIGGNGNWFVEDQDTGVSAQGPQGPAGEFGTPVAKTLPAGSRATAKNLSSDPHVLNLEIGIPQGYNGNKATFSAPTAHRLDQSQAPTVEDLDPDPSNAKLDFGIPDGKKAIVKVTPPVTLPAGSNATVGITENTSDNSYTIQFGIPEGAAGKSIDIHPGVLKPYELPPFASTEVNAAFIVDDGDGWYDLYVRGLEAVPEVQWTIIEDWKGEPGKRWAVVTDRLAIVEDFSDRRRPSVRSMPDEAISFRCLDLRRDAEQESFFRVFTDNGGGVAGTPIYETDTAANPSGEKIGSIAIQDVYALDKVAAIRIEAYHPISYEMMGFHDIPVEHKLPLATTDSPGIVKLEERWAVVTDRLAISEDFSDPDATISFRCLDMRGDSFAEGLDAFFRVSADAGAGGDHMLLYETDSVANPSGEKIVYLPIKDVYALDKVAVLRIEAVHPISYEMMGFHDIPVEHNLPLATTDSPGIVKLGERMTVDANGALSVIPRQYCLRAVPPVVCKDGPFRDNICLVCHYGDPENDQNLADCEWTVEAFDSSGRFVEVSWWTQPASVCYISMSSMVGADVIGIQVTATLIGAQQCSVSKTIPVLPTGSAPVDPGGDSN